MSETKSKPLADLPEKLALASIPLMVERDRCITEANREGLPFERLSDLAKVETSLRNALTWLDKARLQSRELNREG